MPEERREHERSSADDGHADRSIRTKRKTRPTVEHIEKSMRLITKSPVAAIERTLSTALLITCIVGVQAVGAGVGAWTTGGPSAPVSGKLVAITPTSPPTYYLLAGGTLFTSTDGAVTFDQVASPPIIDANDSIQSISIDPRNPSLIFACTQSSVFKSTMGGAAWTLIFRGFNLEDISRILFDPSGTGTLYAVGAASTSTGTYQEWFKSTDGGTSWSNLTVRGSQIDSLMMDPTNSSILYASLAAYSYRTPTSHSTCPYGFKSTDGGATWQDATNMATNVYTSSFTGIPCTYDGQETGPIPTWVISPFDHNTLMAATLAPFGNNTLWLFRTTNAGSAWSLVGPVTTARSALSAIVYWDPISPNTVYMLDGSHAELLKSTDAGASWGVIRSFPSTVLFQDIVFDPMTAGNVFITELDYSSNPQGDLSLLQTIDGGATWKAHPPFIAIQSAMGHGLIVDPHDRNTVYMIGFKSIDGGSNWSQWRPPVETLAIDPITSTTLYGTTASAVFRSVDGGANWVTTGAGPGNNGQIVIDSLTSSTLYMSAQGGVFKSTNDGVDWIPSSAGLPPSYKIGTITIDPTNPSTLYVNGSYNVSGNMWTDANFKSTDGAKSWAPIVHGFGDGPILVDPRNPSTLYQGHAYTNTSILKSIDGGANWGNVYVSGLPFDSYTLVIDPTNPTTLYAAGSKPNGVFESTDGGAHWNAMNSGLPAPFPGQPGQYPTVGGLAISSDGSMLYTSTDHGIFSYTPIVRHRPVRRP
jgi:photosystem II stability/assembly factor-like uncharacterized protein